MEFNNDESYMKRWLALVITKQNPEAKRGGMIGYRCCSKHAIYLRNSASFIHFLFLTTTTIANA